MGLTGRSTGPARVADDDNTFERLSHFGHFALDSAIQFLIVAPEFFDVTFQAKVGLVSDGELIPFLFQVLFIPLDALHRLPVDFHALLKSDDDTRDLGVVIVLRLFKLLLRR